MFFNSMSGAGGAALCPAEKEMRRRKESSGRD
jgi:hypothetical protein